MRTLECKTEKCDIPYSSCKNISHVYAKILECSIDIQENTSELDQSTNGSLLEENSKDDQNLLGKLRKNNEKGLVIAHLNKNSVRNKFDSLKFLVAKNVDIFVISETKIDSTLPPGQFLIEGFKPPLRYDQNRHGGEFVNITAELEIAEIEKNLTKISKSCDPVDVAIDMYKSHPSIKLI